MRSLLLAIAIAASAAKPDVTVIVANDCSEKARAEVGDTLSIEHKGFLDASQIDANPEG